MQYVGMDVHWRRTTICILDENGKRVKLFEVRGAWEKVLGELVRIRGAWQVCFEASCGYGWLYERLKKMAQKVVSRFCERCGGEASAVAKKSNHFLHLILTCLTMGAWVFVWMALLGLDKALDAPRCTECGLIASKSIA